LPILVEVGRAEAGRLLLTGLDGLVVEPAELQLLPGTHVARAGADVLRAVVQPAAGGHQGPEAGAVVAAHRVVHVRETEVVAELVGEDAEAAVLRLGRVVTDPEAGVAQLDAALLVLLGAGLADVVAEGVPAVAPDGVLALGAAAGLLALTGVDRLEVVDVAVRLVEVAVTVVVVAVPDVELREVVADLRVALALGLLVLVPGGGGVLDVVPVALGLAGAVPLLGVVAVAGLVVGHRHPVADVTIDLEASVGLFEVEVLEGLLALREHQVHVVLAVEVLGPDRGVVVGAPAVPVTVRLRYLVVHGA